VRHLQCAYVTPPCRLSYSPSKMLVFCCRLLVGLPEGSASTIRTRIHLLAAWLSFCQFQSTSATSSPPSIPSSAKTNDVLGAGS
jgi:hypothetical protein